MVKDRLNELSFTFLYFNLGGEMMYIINQRLTAQQTSPEKSLKGKRVQIMTVLCNHQHYSHGRHSRIYAFNVPSEFDTIHGVQDQAERQSFKNYF